MPCARRSLARCAILAGWVAAAVLCAPLPASAQAPASAVDGVALMSDVLIEALDDPSAALLLGRQRVAVARAAGRPEAEFWLQLAVADVLVQIDRPAEAREVLAAARKLTDADSAGSQAARRRLWLDVYTRMATPGPAEGGDFAAAQAQARTAARELGDPMLACNVDLVDAIVFIERDASDQAWAALEATERCAAQLGDVGLQTYALGAMGLLASRVSAQLPAQAYFERAIAVLGKQPARYKRAWLHDDLGWSLLDRGELVAARSSFERALALAGEVDDISSVMRAHEGVAEVSLKLKDGTGALQHARESLRLGGAAGLLSRPVTAQTQVVEALALLKRPELAREVERLRAMAESDPSPHTGALISRSAARGYQALGNYSEAYAELERFLELTRIDDKARRDAEAQRLHVRYEAARREAENRDLRHAAEAARLELAVRSERQRALIAAVLALLLLLVSGGTYFGRALRRRRRLADLALRDELTNLPNRRAVLAFAQEQFALAQRLDLPFALALIDLDHFKLINDSHGHAAGDRALQAFGSAAVGMLRGQDRIGRWGGEEWLLVMPGTRAEELGHAFERLRQNLSGQAIAGLPQPHGVTFSMGVAERGAGTESLEALIAEADRQLYRAKAQGRNAVCGVGLPATAEPAVAKPVAAAG
jgi:diguanylate cyclase (GGDEF)-like protein